MGSELAVRRSLASFAAVANALFEAELERYLGSRPRATGTTTDAIERGER